MTASSPAHEPALDGIRGLAVAGVLLFHGGYLNGGYLGVDAFFVLSGFLITTLLLREQAATGTISLAHFWVRRARRLLPAVAAVMLVVAAYAAFVAKSTELNAIRWDAVFTLTYLANWRQVFAHVDYFALYSGPASLRVTNSPLNHTWSLAIEEQFYVFWPILVFLVTRIGSRFRPSQRVLGMSLGLAVLSAAVAQLKYDPSATNKVYYGTDTRVAAILFGAAFAAWRVDHRPSEQHSKRLTIEVLAIATIAALAVAWTRLDGNSTLLYRGGLIACGLGVVLVINAATNPHRGLVYRVLSFAPLRVLGTISYGLYLWHVVVYVVVDEQRTGIHGLALLGVRLAITAGVAWASYEFIERPIRYGAGSKRVWVVAIPTTAAIVATAIVISTLGATSIYSSTQTSSGTGGVLVVGDSVAHSLYPGLARLDYRVNELWSPGCRLIDGKLVQNTAYADRCPWRKDWRTAINRFQPSVVILVLGGWDLFDVRAAKTNELLQPGTPEWSHEFEQAFEAAVLLLSSKGARVVAPSVPCFGASRNATNVNIRSALDVERVRAANAAIENVIAHHPNVTNPDFFRLLCPTGKFQPNLGGVKSARPDGVHLSPGGANAVAKFLQPTIDRLAPQKLLYRSTPFEPSHVAIIGDTPLYEAKPFIAETLASIPSVAPHFLVQPLAAPCDFKHDLEALAKNTKIATIVISLTGQSSTACMRNADGIQIKPGSPAFYARYRADLQALTAIVPSAHVVFAASPPAKSLNDQRVTVTLEEIFRSITKRNSVDTSTNLELGGPQWHGKLPCTPAETAGGYCNDGQIAAYGPSAKVFCPGGYATLKELARGCLEYSGGARRFARAFVRVVVGALAA